MSIVISPTYPASGDEVTLSITPANGTSWVFEITSKPTASAVALGFITLPFAPTGTAQAIIESDKSTNLVIFDAPGDYGITGYDFREIIGIASFGDDPTAGRRFSLRAKHSTVAHIGATMRLPITVASGEGAILQIKTNDIVEDFVNIGVVRSAALIEPTSEVARIATLDPSVIAALATMVGESLTNVGTSLQAGVNNLRSKFEAHRIDILSHLVADNVNSTRTYDSNSVEYSIASLNEIYTRVLGHLQATTLGTRWHTVDDGKNTPVTARATSLAQAIVLMIDLRERVYERHRIQTGSPNVHPVADVTNALTDALPMDTMIVAFLDALVAASSAAPSGESEGANDASHLFGFTHE